MCFLSVSICLKKSFGNLSMGLISHQELSFQYLLEGVVNSWHLVFGCSYCSYLLLIWIILNIVLHKKVTDWSYSQEFFWVCKESLRYHRSFWCTSSTTGEKDEQRVVGISKFVCWLEVRFNFPQEFLKVKVVTPCINVQMFVVVHN